MFTMLPTQKVRELITELKPLVGTLAEPLNGQVLKTCLELIELESKFKAYES